MRVLYLTYDGLTDPLGQSQIMPYLRGLRHQLRGRLELDIVSFEKPARYQRMGKQVRDTLVREGISWYPRSFHSWPPLLAKVYDQWDFERAARALAKQKLYTFYHARSYVAGWVAHRLSEHTGQPWIFDMRGFWVDERRENGLWPASHPFYRWLYQRWKGREQLMLRSAARIIVLSEAASEVLMELGIPPESLTVIPCVADYSLFSLSEAEREAARQSTRTALRIPLDAILLVYSGSVAPHYAPEDLASIFAASCRLNQEVFLLVLTQHEAHLLEGLFRQYALPLSRCRVVSATRSEVPRYLAAADAGIATVRPTFAKVASSFTKLAEYLAADLPVIATAIGDVAALAQKLPGIFPYRSSSEIPAAVEQLLHFVREEKTRLKAPLSALSRPLLGLEIGLDRYRAVYEQTYELTELRRVLTT